jgi:hypothetical protein
MTLFYMNIYRMNWDECTQLSYTFFIYSSNFESNVSKKLYLLYVRTETVLLIESNYIEFRSVILVLLIVTDTFINICYNNKLEKMKYYL